jgi:ABC-type transport system involved in multi-copper enzyme maturation permease subunit
MTIVAPQAVTANERPTTIGFGNVLRSEWTKMRSVRSTYWTLIAAVLSTVALGAVICARWAQIANTKGSGELDGFDATLTSLNGIYLAQIAIGTLGVLVISSEYGTGMIRATFSAVPQRRALLAAKGIVFAAVVLLLGEVMSFAAFGIGQALLSGSHAGVSLGQPGVLQAVAGAGLYLAAVGLLGFGLGTTIRHTAGALSAFFGLLFGASAIVALLPTSWREAVLPYMPANAGSQIFTIVRSHGALGPWTGLGVFCLYVVAAVGAGFVLVTARDA